MILILCIIPILLYAEEQAIFWREFPNSNFLVNGLPFWQENLPDFFRLPKSLQNKVRKPVWNLSKSPSGGRIRFRSNCTTLAIKLQYPHLSNMKNMHTFGQCGVDLYINNTYIRTAVPTDSTYIRFVFFENQKAEMRNITLYLPLYMGVKIIAIGVNPKAIFDKPMPFATEKPVVYYGSSITQGGCASHPGMSYQAIISRNLNIDFVNQGYSGNGMGEPEIAEVITQIDASCYVLDFGVNLPSADSLAKVYGPFLNILRTKRPKVPIIAITPIYNTHEFWEPNKATFMRDVIRKEIASSRMKGAKNILLVEGLELLGPDYADAFVDGVHPNDLGFLAMAERLQPYLARMLNLSGSNYKLKK
jgi:lysophospholipase L1-like esterase